MTHMEDYFRLLNGGLQALGHTVSASYSPESGYINLIFENFETWLLEEMLAVSGKAEFVILGTEFITGDTFNNFNLPATHVHAPVAAGVGAVSADEAEQIQQADAPARANSARPRRSLVRWAGGKVKRLVPSPVNAAVRAGVMRYDMDILHKNRMRFNNHDPYSDVGAWKYRFEGFQRAVSISRAIWCVDPSQEDAYRSFAGALPVGSLVLGYMDGVVPLRPDVEQQYDFLFTGTMTSHRYSVLARLMKAGFKVRWTPPTNPGFLREILTAGARFTLGIKQSPDWRYPSTLRNYYYLMAASPFLVEKTEKPSYLDQYLFVSDDDDYVAYCVRIAGEKDDSIREQVKTNLEAYKAEPGWVERLEKLIQSTLA